MAGCQRVVTIIFTAEPEFSCSSDVCLFDLLSRYQLTNDLSFHDIGLFLAELIHLVQKSQASRSLEIGQVVEALAVVALGPSTVSVSANLADPSGAFANFVVDIQPFPLKIALRIKVSRQLVTERSAQPLPSSEPSTVLPSATPTQRICGFFYSARQRLTPQHFFHSFLS